MIRKNKIDFTANFDFDKILKPYIKSTRTMQEQDKFKELLLKISPKIKGKIYAIPYPSLSPTQRRQRRLAFRNENKLYRRKSTLSGANIISVFHQDSPFKIYSHEEWWNDNWDPMEYGADTDFSLGFFEQFYQLMLKVPRSPLINNKAENSPYCNFADGNKNCHLITSANWSEDSYYCFLIVSCKNAVDCIWCVDSEIMYECTDCRNCYDLRFCEHCGNCSESAFLYDCIGQKNSIFCNGQQHGQYQIFNRQVPKEQFLKTFDYYFSGSHKRLEEAKQVYKQFLNSENNLRKKFLTSSDNVSGNNIWNSHNITDCYDVFDSEDSWYLNDGLKAKDCSDICFFDGTELCYESTSLVGYGYRFTNFCRDSANLFYCDSCYGCEDCFACIGLRNKKTCIFNKQYTRDEYEALVGKIIDKMILEKSWGEFFPVKYSPFAYNETLSGEYYPLPKDEVKSNGWQWREESPTDFHGSKVDIPDNIQDAGKDFINKVLICEESGKNYKIIESELNFYKLHKIPIPTKSPEQRLKERAKKRVK